MSQVQVSTPNPAAPTNIKAQFMQQNSFISTLQEKDVLKIIAELPRVVEHDAVKAEQLCQDIALYPAKAVHVALAKSPAVEVSPLAMKVLSEHHYDDKMPDEVCTALAQNPALKAAPEVSAFLAAHDNFKKVGRYLADNTEALGESPEAVRTIIKHDADFIDYFQFNLKHCENEDVQEVLAYYADALGADNDLDHNLSALGLSHLAPDFG